MRIHKDISLKEIEKMINKKFIGKIKQIPPVKSRVKRQEREREIKKFKILEKSGKDVLFKVECEGGTYIRKLVDDLGKELNIQDSKNLDATKSQAVPTHRRRSEDFVGIGAHMLELRRIRAGIFSEDDKNYPSINLYDFEKAVKEYSKDNDKLLREIIIPGEIISKLHPVVQIKENNLKQIFTGKPIHKKDLKKDVKIKKNETVCVFCEDRFVGIYKIINTKYVFAKPEFVLQPLE